MAEKGGVGSMADYLKGKRFGKGKMGKMLTVEQREGLFGILSSGSKDLKDLEARRGAGNRGKKKILEDLEKAGLKGINKGNAYNYMRMYQGEKGARRFINPEFQEESKDPVIAKINSDIRDTVNERTTTIIGLLEQLVRVNDPEYKASDKKSQKQIFKYGKKLTAAEEKIEKANDKALKIASKNKSSIAGIYQGLDLDSIKGFETPEMTRRSKEIKSLGKAFKFDNDVYPELMNMDKETFDLSASSEDL